MVSSLRCLESFIKAFKDKNANSHRWRARLSACKFSFCQLKIARLGVEDPFSEEPVSKKDKVKRTILPARTFAMAFWPALTILSHAWLLSITPTYVWSMAPSRNVSSWASKNNSPPSFHEDLVGGGNNPTKPRVHVPKYMLELYETMKNSHHLDGTTANVVRSYGNINGDVFRTQDNLFNEREENVKSNTRIHTLVFNVTSLPENEQLEKADLRLFALIQRDQRVYFGVEREVTISACSDSVCEVITSRHVYETASVWETFNVTPAINIWLDKNKENQEQRLEVYITSVFTSKYEDDLDFQVEPFSDTEPLLLVYSSDRGRSLPVDAHSLSRRSTDMEDAEEESNSIFETDPVRKINLGKNLNSRKRLKNPCRRRPLYVNFTDINYDTWIIAPSGYDAYECTGKCFFPLSDHLSPTKHAIIQTLLHTVASKKASRACCVPTELKPISLLYINDKNVVTYNFHYSEMVVAKCGCR